MWSAVSFNPCDFFPRDFLACGGFSSTQWSCLGWRAVFPLGRGPPASSTAEGRCCCVPPAPSRRPSPPPFSHCPSTRWAGGMAVSFIGSSAVSPAISVLPFWTKKVTRLALFFCTPSDGRDLKADFLCRVLASGGLFSSRRKSATFPGDRMLLRRTWVGLGDSTKVASRTPVGDSNEESAGPLKRLARKPWAMAPGAIELRRGRMALTRLPGQSGRAASDALLR